MKQLGHPRNYWRVSPERADLCRGAQPPQPISFAAEPQWLTIDLARSAVVVVDMQNDFCSPDGWLGSIGVETSPLLEPVAPLGRLLPTLRQAGVPVVWLNWGNRADRMNLYPSVLHVYDPDGSGTGIGSLLPRNGSRVLEQGSWGAALVEGLEAAPEDVRVDKFRMSGFWDTPLDSILRNIGAQTLLFAGVNLDQCVMHTLQDAVCLGYDAVLLADCCATSSPAFCAEAALYNIKQCYGFVALSSVIVDTLAATAGKDEEG